MKARYVAIAIVLTVCSIPVFSCAPMNHFGQLKFYPYMGQDSWKTVLRNINSDEYDEFQISSAVYRFYPDDKFGSLVSRHINEMSERHCFDEISWTDLFHGHLLFSRECPNNFKDVDEMVASVEAILYHTREFIGQWEEMERVGRPLSRRPPRSLIGQRHGKIAALKDIIDISRLEHDNYVRCGTIHADDVCRQKTCYKDCRNIAVMINGARYRIDPNGVSLVRRPTGRHVIGEQRFDIFIRLIRQKS